MEYKYLTQELIDKGNVNITSPEMFEEARRYNIEAFRNYKKRFWIKVFFGFFIAAQTLYVIGWTLEMIQAQHGYERSSGDNMAGWKIFFAALGGIAYLALMFWFAYIKGSRDRFTLCLISVPVIAISIYMAGIPVANYLAGLLYAKSEEAFSKKLGYPSFPRIVTNAVFSEADNIKDLSYDSIREKARRDHPDSGDFLG